MAARDVRQIVHEFRRRGVHDRREAS